MQSNPNTRRNLINPDAARKIARGQQRQGYLSGEALRQHAKTAHNGQVLESCPACREIQKKMDEFHSPVKK